MSKQVTIHEEDICDQAEDSRDEIVEQLTNPPPPMLDPIVSQKAEARMRVRELYKCEGCNKYLTKKSLNYSHHKTCAGNPENQIKREPPPKYEERPPSPRPIQQPIQQPTQIPVRQISLYDPMRIERQRQHHDNISRLAMFIA